MWINSIAAADFKAFSRFPPTASDTINVKAGLSIFPPALVRYTDASARFSGVIADNSSSIVFVMSVE